MLTRRELVKPGRLRPHRRIGVRGGPAVSSRVSAEPSASAQAHEVQCREQAPVDRWCQLASWEFEPAERFIRGRNAQDDAAQRRRPLLVGDQMHPGYGRTINGIGSLDGVAADAELPDPFPRLSELASHSVAAGDFSGVRWWASFTTAAERRRLERGVSGTFSSASVPRSRSSRRMLLLFLIRRISRCLHQRSKTLSERLNDRCPEFF